MVMTPSEKRWYKEKVIRDYKHELGLHEKNNILVRKAAKVLRKLVPLNITVGLGAAIIYYYFNGWTALLNLLLAAVVWIALMGTVLSAIMKPR